MTKFVTTLIALTMTLVLSGCLFGKKEDAAPVEAPAATEETAPTEEMTAPTEGESAEGQNQ